MARKKIYPALFALYVEDMLPENFTIYGYARSKMSDEEFRDYIGGSLTCRVTDEDSCGDKYDTFLDRCYYQPGQYSEQSDFKALSDRMTETEKVCLPLPCAYTPSPPFPSSRITLVSFWEYSSALPPAFNFDVVVGLCCGHCDA